MSMWTCGSLIFWIGSLLNARIYGLSWLIFGTLPSLFSLFIVYANMIDYDWFLELLRHISYLFKLYANMIMIDFWNSQVAFLIYLLYMLIWLWLTLAELWELYYSISSSFNSWSKHFGPWDVQPFHTWSKSSLDILLFDSWSNLLWSWIHSWPNLRAPLQFWVMIFSWCRYHLY